MHPDPICDCHIHVFGPDPRPDARYQPPPKTLGDFRREANLGGRVTHAVVVQASIDGTDNSRLLATLADTQGLDLRGVAVIDETTPDLQAMAAAGVSAIRIQDRPRLGITDLERLPQLAPRAASVGWHVELNTEPARFDRLRELMRGLPHDQPLVLDHMGHIDPAAPSDLDALCRLLDSGRVWVKLAMTRVTSSPEFTDIRPAITRLTGDFPDRCLWGSDWPHVLTDPPLPQSAKMIQTIETAIRAPRAHDCLSWNPLGLYFS